LFVVKRGCFRVKYNTNDYFILHKVEHMSLNLIGIIEAYAMQPNDYTPSQIKRLWGSEMGQCLRKTAFRLNGVEETHPFEPATLRVMAQGVVSEAETGRALAWEFGKRLRQQVALQNACWSGKLDFVLDSTSEHPTIIEHKATSDYAFSGLPRQSHVEQLWLYGELYRQEYGHQPALVLFYRGWSKTAEFVLVEEGNVLVVRGGEKEKEVRYSLKDLRKRKLAAEQVYTAWGHTKSLAEELIPPRLDDPTQGCTFGNGKIACAYYGHCWPSEE
jgi:hypothetical protein